jgi:hypothetical protein
MSLSQWILGATLLALTACSVSSQESEVLNDVLSGSSFTLKIDPAAVAGRVQIHDDLFQGYPAVAPGSAEKPQYWGEPGHAASMKFLGLNGDATGQVGKSGFRFDYTRCPSCQEHFASRSGWMRILPYSTIKTLDKKYRVNVKAHYNYLTQKAGDVRTFGGHAGVLVGCRRTVAAGGWMPDPGAINEDSAPLGIREFSSASLPQGHTWKHGVMQLQTQALDLKKCGGDLYLILSINGVVGAQFFDPEVQLLAVAGG